MNRHRQSAPRSRALGWRLGAIAGALLAAACAAPAAPAEGLGKQIVELTGSRTRIIWERGCRDGYGVLMCFDTDEGRERVVLPGGPQCKDPKLTPDGTRIAFTGPDRTAYIVNWDGSGLKPLIKGRYNYVMGVSVDPATRKEWVYVADSESTEAVADIKSKGIQASEDSGLALYRHRLDDMSVKELVWDKVPFNRRINVSADGAHIFGEFPWPNCAFAILPNVSWKMLGQGCNANLAPDNSGMFFHLIGDHRSIKVYNKDGGQRSQLPLNTMPGIEKDPERKVWRPRWSNNIRFLTVQSSDLGRDADIGIGRFDEGFTKIEAWVRVTDTTDYDADSFAWIKPVPPLGANLTDGLDVPALKELVARLESAKEAGPVMAEVARLAKDASNKTKADAAQAVIEHVERWVNAQMAKARGLESTDTPAAVGIYQKVRARFKGTEWGTDATARLKDPALKKATPLGAKLTDNLDVSLLKDVVARLEAAPAAGLVLAEIEKLAKDSTNEMRADEARDVLDHVTRWADAAMEKATGLEAEDPLAAGRAYQKLATRFKGMECGTKAAARLKDPALLKEAKAWQYLLKVQKAAKGLQDVAGAESKASDKKWLAKNSYKVGEIKAAAKLALQYYPGSTACAKIQEILDQYGIETGAKR